MGEDETWKAKLERDREIDERWLKGHAAEMAKIDAMGRRARRVNTAKGIVDLVAFASLTYVVWHFIAKFW